MIHTSANRATPVSVDNITKLVRQHYKPVTDQGYSHEKVQCRTDTTCQRSKPEDYWITNFHRRKSNMQKGFYSGSTEPYRPIGGELVLDPCELALSTLPGTINRKINPRMARRGTIYEDVKAASGTDAKDKGEDEISTFTSQDLVDTAPSAGYEDIKKLLKETRHRIISVRAGKSYEDHVKTVEEAQRLEKEANKPEDTGMIIKSVSSIYMSTQANNKTSRPTSRAMGSGRSVLSSGDRVGIPDVIKAPSPLRRKSGDKARLRPPSLKTKITLMQAGTGISNIVNRKERKFKDHMLYLESIYKVLTALHNLKVKDIKSKAPLSKEVVERLQKENSKEDDTRGSRGTYVLRGAGRQRGNRFSTDSFRGGAVSRRTSFAQSEVFSEFGEIDDFSPRKHARLLPIKMKEPSTPRGKRTQLSMLQVEGDQGEGAFGARMSIYCAAKCLNTLDNATRTVFGRRLKTVIKEQKMERSREGQMENAMCALFTSAAKRLYLADQVNKQFMHLRGQRRRSKNAANISSDRQSLETWEDLLNVQPEQYKEETPGGGGGLCFQVGVISKFMRWYRRASIVPTHSGPSGAGIERSQLSQLQDINEKSTQAAQQDKGEQRDTYVQQPPGSAAQTTERVKKLPIWQQVAQEKSTVFENLKKKAPDPDSTIQRFKKNLNKLKRSVQKENTATLEKMVRERVANFRLKFSALDTEECSPLFDEQKLKLQDVKDKVNKSHLENFDVQPSKWFEELREKTTSLISSYHQPQLADTLLKVQNYAHMDNKTVSYAKAKLCLLMMSLPAYDICQIYTQKALKFIFEHILLGQEAQFYEWLNHRKIPNMVIDDSLPRSNTPSKF